MRSRYVTLLFPLPLAGRASPLYSLSRLRGRVGWGLLGDRLGAMAGQEVLGHRVHGRPLLIFDLFLLDPVALILVVDQLHGLVDFFEQVNAVAVTQVLEAHLHDGEGHLREVEEGLVSVHAHAEVDLRDGAEAVRLGDGEQ